MKQLNVGVFIYPNVTMLDAYAPHQIFSYVEQFNTFIFARNKEPLVSDSNTILTANYGFVPVGQRLVENGVTFQPMLLVEDK